MVTVKENKIPGEIKVFLNHIYEYNIIGKTKSTVF